MVGTVVGLCSDEITGVESLLSALSGYGLEQPAQHSVRRVCVLTSLGGWVWASLLDVRGCQAHPGRGRKQDWVESGG